MPSLEFAPQDQDSTNALGAYAAGLAPPLPEHNALSDPEWIKIGRAVLGATGQEAQNFVSGIGNALALPHDVMTGQVNPLSPQGFASVQQLAGMLSLGGLTGGGEAGTLKVGLGGKPTGFAPYSFGGKLSGMAPFLDSLPDELKDAAVDIIGQMVDKLHYDPLLAAQQLGMLKGGNFTQSSYKNATSSIMDWLDNKEDNELDQKPWTAQAKGQAPAPTNFSLGHPTKAPELPVDWIVNGKMADPEDPAHVAAVIDAHDANHIPQSHMSGWFTSNGVHPDTEAAATMLPASEVPKATPLYLSDVKLINSLPEHLEEYAYPVIEYAKQHGSYNYAEAGNNLAKQTMQAATPKGMPTTWTKEEVDKLYEVSLTGMLHNQTGQELDIAQMSGAGKPAAPKAPITKPLPAKPPAAKWATAPSWTPPDIKSPEEAVYPINFQDLHSLFRRPAEVPDPAYQAQLARAQSLGFNTNLPLYKGLETDPGFGSQWKMPEEEPAWTDPASKPNERGIFAADTPQVSNMYAGGLHAETFPMFARADKPFAVNWPDVAGDPSYDGGVMSKLIEHTRKIGGDLLVVNNIRDVGGPQTQYVIMHPNRLRSQFAAFAPEHRESPVLTRAAGVPLAGQDQDQSDQPVIIKPVPHDPFSTSLRPVGHDPFDIQPGGP